MKKHLWKLLIAAFAVTSAFTSHALAYSPNDAINYAEQYANSYNLLDSSGSGFNNYHPNDCTNFVSQCIYIGGLAQDTTWYSRVIYQGDRVIREDSLAWRVANTFKNYLRDINGSTKIGSWSLLGSPQPYLTYQYVDNSNNLTTSNKGKVVLFYDWTGDGQMNHAAFFVKNNGQSLHSSESGKVGDLVDQHSGLSNKYILWRPDYRQATSQRLTTRVYAFQLNV